MDEMILLSTYCGTHNIDYDYARRLARKNQFVGAVKTLGVWAINKNAPVPELPTPNTRGSSRTDGRRRYIAYLTDAEHQTFGDAFGDAEIVNPREQRRVRADAKRAGLDLTDGAIDNVIIERNADAGADENDANE